MTDQERFAQACLRAGEERRREGIGTLSEKQLHAALKYYLEPYEGSHEVKVGGYVADIVGEHGIVEIQTRSFDRLRRKLAAFLEATAVTVAYPIPRVKWLIWVDPETGEASRPRKSPKTGSPADAFRELYRIRPLLTHPNLSLRLILVDIEELRYLDGWSRDRKKGSTRCERIPVALGEELLITPGGYGVLVPPSLEEPFSSRDFQRAARLSRSAAQTALNVLHYVGAVRRTGKQGNAYLYERT